MDKHISYALYYIISNLSTMYTCTFSQHLAWYKYSLICGWIVAVVQSFIVSDSLRQHGLQHTRPPCTSPTPGLHSNSCPLSRWCHPTISSSVAPFSSYRQSFWASGYFPVSQLSSLQVAKLLELQFQHQSFQWNSGLISFRIDWLDLLAV